MKVSRRWAACLMTLLLSGLLCAGATAQELGPWVSLGPAPSRMSPINEWMNVEGMVQGGNACVGAMNITLEDPSRAGVLYVGTANGGVWKSANGGASWVPLTDRLSSLSIGGMAFDRADPSRLYIGFGKQSNYGESGGPLNSLKLSTDGGASWTSPDAGNVLLGRDVTRILADGTTILVGIKNPADGATGLYRTTDGGANFAAVGTASGLAAGIVDDLKYDPGYNGTTNRSLYAAVRSSDDSAGVYRSDDGGASWTHLSTLPTAGKDSQRILLSTGSGVLAAMVVNGKQAAATTVYRSTDGGATWTSMAQPVTRDYEKENKLTQQGLFPGGQFNNAALYVDPKNPNIVYVSGDRQPGDLTGKNANSIGAKQYSGRLFRGVYDPATGRTTWEPLTHSGTLSNSSPHADSRSIFIDSKGRLIQTDDGGIYARSTPQGKGDWTPLHGNIAVSEVDAASWNPLANRAVCGMQDNGSAYQIAGGGAWGSINGGDGGTNAVNYQTFGSSGTAVIYASTQFLGGLMRFRMDKDGNPIPASKTYLGPYVGEGSAKTYISDNKNFVQFYPALTLNRTNQTRIAIGGMGLYVGQDDPTVEVKPEPEDNPASYDIPVATLVTPAQVAATGITHKGFGSVAYGAADRLRAIVAGVGDAQYGDQPATYLESEKLYGQLWYSDDVDATAAVRLTNAETVGGKRTYGIQAVLFDGRTGSGNLYATDAFRVLRGTRNGQASLYDFADIGSALPARFIYRRALEYVSANGVNALLAGGAHSSTTNTDVNPLYYTVDPATYSGATWTPLGKLLPNAPVMSLHYSELDDVLLVSTLGRGLFAMYDLTAQFPQARNLTFGKADNDSAPEPAILTDGVRADGTPFSRPLIKVGQGALILPNAAATYSGGTQFLGGVVAAYRDESFGAGNWTFNGGALAYLAGFESARAISLGTGGGAFDTNGKQAALSGVISGPGSLVLTGGGTLSLKGASTYSGGTLVDNGLLLFSNTTGSATGSGDVYIKTAGRFGGKGSISGNLVNTGEADPGESVGTLTIGGNYTQETAGTMRVEVESAGSDLLIVGGEAALNGRLQTVLLGGHRPALGERHTILQAASVTGAFTSLDTRIDGTRTLVFKPLYLPARADIIAERDYLNSSLLPSLTPGQRSVAAMLNTLANTPQGSAGDLNTVLGAIDALPADGQVAAAMDQIAPRGEVGLSILATNGVQVQAGNVTDRLGDLRTGAAGVSLQGLNFEVEQDETLNRRGRPVLVALNGDGWPAFLRGETNPDWGGFIRGNWSESDLKTASTSRLKSTGITAGSDYRFANNLAVGIMGGYTRGKADLDDQGSRATLDAWNLGVYGTFFDGGFHMDGQLSAGWNNTRGERRIVFPGINRTAVSDEGGRTCAAAAGMGYDIPAGNWVLTPMISAEYVRLALDGYTESGADALNLTVEGRRVKLLQGHAGASAAYVWKGESLTVTPKVWALYGHEFDRDGQEMVTARLATGSVSFNAYAVPPDRDFLTLGGQVLMSLPRGQSLYLNVGGQVGQSNYSSWNVGLGARFLF